MRVLSIDHGGRRIGLAVSDPLGLTVRPVATVDRRKDRDPVGTIVALVKELEATGVLLGIPIEPGGALGESAERVLKFKGRLLDRLRGEGVDVPLFEADEAYTTTEAHARLKARGVAPLDRKTVIDQEAAAVLLEGWLRDNPPPPL